MFFPEIDSRHAERWSQNTSWPTELWGYYSSDEGIFKAFYRDIMINTIHIYTWHHQQYDMSLPESRKPQLLSLWTIEYSMKCWNSPSTPCDRWRQSISTSPVTCTLHCEELRIGGSSLAMIAMFVPWKHGRCFFQYFDRWFVQFIPCIGSMYSLKALRLNNWNLGTTRSCHNWERGKKRPDSIWVKNKYDVHCNVHRHNYTVYYCKNANAHTLW